MSEFASYDPTLANLSIASAALGWTIYSALNAFRYRSNSAYYTFSKIGTDTNYYELSDTISLYGGTVMGGILTLTSLAAAFGSAQ